MSRVGNTGGDGVAPAEDSEKVVPSAADGGRPQVPIAPKAVEHTPSMIERVAEGLWQAESVRATGKRRRILWNEEGDKARESWRFMARAAIEAMRNPTDEMLDACQRALVDTMRDLGWSKAQRAGRLSAQTKSVMRWNAMIDAALSKAEGR